MAWASWKKWCSNSNRSWEYLTINISIRIYDQTKITERLLPSAAASSSSCATATGADIVMTNSSHQNTSNTSSIESVCPEGTLRKKTADRPTDWRRLRLIFVKTTERFFEVSSWAAWPSGTTKRSHPPSALCRLRGGFSNKRSRRRKTDLFRIAHNEWIIDGIL